MSASKKRRVGYVLTDRDVEIVRWIGRHRFATAEQVSRRFSMHRTKTYERLRALVKSELIRCEPGIRSARIYLATTKGIATAHLNVPRASLSIASFTHDNTVVDVAISFELDPRFRVLTEREIRRSGPLKNNRYAVRLIGNYSPNPTGCWPDLVVERLDTGKLWAIEVELSQKKAERLESKLHGYRASQYERVTYLVAHRGIANAITKHFPATRAQDLVDVHPLSDAINRHAGDESTIQAEFDKLRGEIHQTRDEVASLRGRLLERERTLEKTESALQTLVGDVRTYLHADRASRSRIREHWTRTLGKQLP